MDYTVREAAIEDLDMLVSFAAEEAFEAEECGKIRQINMGEKKESMYEP